MTEESPTTPPSIPEGNTPWWKEVARQVSEKVSAPFVWAADQISAPLPKIGTTPEDRAMTGAARRGYFQALRGLRAHGEDASQIRIILRSTDGAVVAQVREEIAQCLNDRAPGETGEIPSNFKDRVPAAMRYLGRNQVTVTQAPALADDAARLEAAATHIAGSIAGFIKGRERKTISVWEFNAVFLKHSRKGDFENGELVERVKAILKQEPHNITVREEDPEPTEKSGSNGFFLGNLRSAIAGKWEKFKDWKSAPETADEIGGAAARMYYEYLAWRRKADDQTGGKCELSFREGDEEPRDDGVVFCVQVAKRLEDALIGRFGKRDVRPSYSSRGRLNDDWNLQFVSKEPLPEGQIVEQIVARLKEETKIGQKRVSTTITMTLSDKDEAMKWVRFWVRKTDKSPESDKLIEKVVDALQKERLIILTQDRMESA